MSKATDKIIIALDVETLEQARELVTCLSGTVDAFKIGKQLYTRCGPEAVDMVHAAGSRVFLDLKYHDIPTTVAKAGCEAARMGVFIFNVHALGGSAMIAETAKAVREMATQAGAPAPLILAVTILTSMTESDLAEIGIHEPVEQVVVRLARLAQAAGADGVVASPREIGLIKKACGTDFVVLTPGIRPAASTQDDQKRTMTPAQALAAGADFLVIGRPVTQAPDPQAAARAIASELDAAEK
jgi:orotidine-5'-phosphate decarboxylase